jgi:hypothetical protein
LLKNRRTFSRSSAGRKERHLVTAYVQTAGIEVSLLHADSRVKLVKIFLDDVEAAQTSGAIWAKGGISSGVHTVRVVVVQTAVEATRVANFSGGDIVKLEFTLP